MGEKKFFVIFCESPWKLKRALEFRDFLRIRVGHELSEGPIQEEWRKT